MTNNQPISYPYLTGYLQQTLKSLSTTLASEGIVKWNSPEFKKVMDIVDKELKRAHKAEREFSSR